MMSHQPAINNVAYYHTSASYYSLQSFHQRRKMRGAQRVIIFCILTAVLPTVLLIIPLYLRHIIYADVTFAVAESDVIEIVDGVSSVFCQEHSLRMNTSFQAFQVRGKPQLSNIRKHIRLKKSMSLPDDTLEYWGFYLLKGSTVALSVCSRYDGSRILVVKGERNLRTCGLLDHSLKPLEAHMANGQGQVRVTFETEAQEIRSGSLHNSQIIKQKQVTELDENDQYAGEVSSNEYLHDARHGLGLATDLSKNTTDEELLPENKRVNLTGPSITRKHRHAQYRSRNLKHNNNKTLKAQYGGNKSTENFFNSEESNGKIRVKRRNMNVPIDHLLDGGIGHGHGGDLNETLLDTTDSSMSSFENSLLNCYDGQILLVQGFPPSQNCSSVKDVKNHHKMKTSHDVVSDGYYYYIFFSDNDVVQNDIHAVFDIHKTTYQFTNHIKGCINNTECAFPLSFWSDDTVVVEVPTRDGIEHEDDDITYLVSTCYPRMAVYIIFPVLVLFLILGCAFL